MGRSHVLQAGPDTVHWGYFDAALAPALTIESGDAVRIETGAAHQPFLGLERSHPVPVDPDDQPLHLGHDFGTDAVAGKKKQLVKGHAGIPWKVRDFAECYRGSQRMATAARPGSNASLASTAL